MGSEPTCGGCARVICVCPPPDEQPGWWGEVDAEARRRVASGDLPIEPDEQRAGGVTHADLADGECYCDVCGSDDALGVRPICMVCYVTPNDISEQVAAFGRELDRARWERYAATARAETAEGLLRLVSEARAELIVKLDQCRGDYVGTYAEFAGGIAALVDTAIRAHLQSLKGGSDAEG